MNYKVRYAVLAVLTLGVIVTLAFAFTTPLLYSLGNDQSVSSRFHENVDALKALSQNSTTDIDPYLQEMIDFAGPVSLTIEIHDFEEARRYLELFGERRASIKNLIVRMDMEDSEIQELEKNTALQKQILESLLSTSISLDDLQSMEIQYYSESTQELRTPFRLRGNELRKKVQGLNQRYRNATEKVETIGTKLGLDVTKNKESVTQVEKIIRKIEQPETSDIFSPVTTPVPGVTTPVPGVTTPVPGVTTPVPGVTTPVPGVTTPVPGITTPVPGTTTSNPGINRVSLAIKPETGIYGKNIEYTGISLNPQGNTTPRSESNPVSLYIDEKPASTTVTDKFGFYTVRIPIERLLPGNHTAYSQSPTSRSDNRTVMVTSTDSVTYLVASNPDPDGNVVFEGYVETNEAPVMSAPVQITWDQSYLAITTTDEDGYFKQKIQFSPGRHSVVANFSGDGYPVNPSQSSPLIVDIPYIRGLGVGNGQVWLVLSVIAISILLLAGVFFSLRNSRKRTTQHTGSFENADISPDQSDHLHSTALPQEIRISEDRKSGNETLFMGYNRLLKELGLSAASRLVYEQLSGRMANDFHIKIFKSLTARELSRNCRGKPYCGAFSRFVAIYERIRYGGTGSDDDQTSFETALTLVDEQMGYEK